MKKPNIKFKGVLFDLDGTLIDSLQAVDRAWRSWAKKVGLNADDVMQLIHGRPAQDSVAELLHGQSEQVINKEIRWLEDYEANDTQGTLVLPGSIKFLHLLNKHHIPWAIVTSGTLPVATARINASGIPQPQVLITPEKVTYGKPHPEPFLLGAQELGLDPKDCIVFEDAPAGIKAGKLAGSIVIGILSHYKAQQLKEAVEHINSLKDVSIQVNDDLFELYFLHS